MTETAASLHVEKFLARLESQEMGTADRVNSPRPAGLWSQFTFSVVYAVIFASTFG
jgi:hypothetical protein